MRVLVTGATGLIGAALVERLLAGGPVVRLVRGRPAAGSTSPDWGTASTGAGPDRRPLDVGWDPSTGMIDRRTLEDAGPIDAVVNLAGAGIGDRRWSPARKDELVRSRTAATDLVVDAMLGLPAPPPVLVNASAVGFYGLRGDEELTEGSPSGTGFLAGLCRQWEAATRPAAESGIRTVFLRSGIVLAGRGGALGRQLPLFRLGAGGRTGAGTQYRSWITLDDEVDVIRHCLVDGAVSGPVNATAPTPVTDAELAVAIGAAIHRPAVLAVPAPLVRLALGREMADELVLGGQRVLPGVLTARGYRFGHTRIDHALSSALTPRN